MKFFIEKPTTNAVNHFRRAGYHFQKHAGEEMAFIRKLTDQDFPRFHAFVKTVEYKFHVNIHIDHKAASYEGTSAHSGEYDKDSELLKSEAERVKSLAGN